MFVVQCVCVCVGSIAICNRHDVGACCHLVALYFLFCDFVFVFCRIIFISLIQHISVNDSFSHIHVFTNCDYDKFAPIKSLIQYDNMNIKFFIFLYSSRMCLK
jgi:hypothetical protein